MKLFFFPECSYFLLLRYFKISKFYLCLTVIVVYRKKQCSENWDENCHSPQHKCKIYFFDWKKHSCPEKVDIANGHVFSHQQSCKTVESEDAHANEGRQERT